jgi:hypothetical protein
MTSTHGRPDVQGTATRATLDFVTVRRFGFFAAIGVVVLSAAYFVPLVVGLLTLPSPNEPIADPWFTMMEVLILLSTPMMVVLMVGIYAWAPRSRKPFGLAAVVFMALAGAITCAVHFTILALRHQEAISSLPWAQSLLSFDWPSVPYALDILAWDVFFPISILLAIPAFAGIPHTRAITVTLLISGVLSIAGLAGLVLNDMRVRDIGVVGYAVVFPIAAAFMAYLFRTPPNSQR